MNLVNTRIFAAALSLGMTLGLFSIHAHALPDDRDQPINISANNAQKDDKKGLTIYSGDVVMSQGSITVKGDKVTIFDVEGEIEKIVAVGIPAHFTQIPQVGDEPVIAHGQTLEYSLQKETLLLLEDAFLKQDKSTTKSNRITYDIKSAIVNAGNNTGRVNMVVQPSKKTQQ